MNRRMVAKELVRVAKSIISNEEDKEVQDSSGEVGFEAFQKHVFESLSTEAKNMLDLYRWYQAHHNASTRSIDVSRELLEIMKLLEEMAQYVQDSEEDDEPQED